VGRYEILKKLGQGSTGTVYLGRDPFIKRDVAVKMSRPTSNRARDRFFVEAQSAGRLNHPNIVSVYDLGLHEEYCYLTMEYVDGPTLEKYAGPDTLLPLTRVVEIAFSVCVALDYAHKQGIIHKDIKPSNIMLDPAGNVKITDFGIAQMTEQTVELGIFGTPSYMSPEQLKDQVVGQESDIFSLGCVLYEIIGGQQAFQGENDFAVMYKITNEEPPSALAIRPDLPEIFERILNKALAKDVKARYPTCLALAYDLRVAYRGLKGVPSNEKIRDMAKYVGKLPFFHNFSSDQVKELVAASTILSVPKGKLIVAEGEIDDTFYVLVSGKAKVTVDDREIAAIRSGECFGEMAGIGGQPRVASVVAASDCILLQISATLLDNASPSIQLLFYKNFTMTLVKRLSTAIKPTD
jgi:serine/threonine-protein kinase